jgi:hypothetical protein
MAAALVPSAGTQTLQLVLRSGGGCHEHPLGACPRAVVELSTAHARKQFEAMTAQTKELTTLAQKVTIETAEPLKTEVTRAFNKVA